MKYGGTMEDGKIIELFYLRDQAESALPGIKKDFLSEVLFYF